RSSITKLPPTKIKDRTLIPKNKRTKPARASITEKYLLNPEKLIIAEITATIKPPTINDINSKFFP
ncbi:hypothetical protein EBU91_02280, partial [bacterium]|nr:hypothetical protein [bacterium]